MKKLNLGCGKDIKKDYINLDIVKFNGVDVVHDLNKPPYPFKDNEFEEIICNSIIEHLENIPIVMDELYRILQPEGVIKIVVPHFTSVNAYSDPTHKHLFSYFSFDLLTDGSKYGLNFKYEIIKRRLRFAKKRAVWNYIVEGLANRFPHLYENTLLRIFPAMEIYVEMKKILCKKKE